MVTRIAIRLIVVTVTDGGNKPVCITLKSLKLHSSEHFISFDMMIFEINVIIQILCFFRFT